MTDASPGNTVRGRLADLATDVAGVAGAGLIVWGVDLIYRPAALIVAGAFLLLGAWIAARKAG